MSLFFSPLPYKLHRVYIPILTVLSGSRAPRGAPGRKSALRLRPRRRAGQPGRRRTQRPPPRRRPRPAAAARRRRRRRFAALSAKVDEADQNARIAARKLELLEEQLASKAKESPGVIADERGFGVRSADGAYQLRFRGQLQADSRWFLGDTNLSDRLDTFLLRRFRPGFDGTRVQYRGFSFHPRLRGRHRGDLRRLRRHPPGAVPAPARRQVQDAARARAPAGRPGPAVHRTRAHPVPDAHTRRRRSRSGATSRAASSTTTSASTTAATTTRTSTSTRNHAKDVDAPAADPAVQGRAVCRRWALWACTSPRARATGAGCRRRRCSARTRPAGLNTFFSYLAPASDPDGSKTVVRVPDPEADQPGHLLLLRTVRRFE